MTPVKRYVNAIERKLKLPFQIKVRVMNDLSTSMTARHEAGESWEAIMADLGTPEEAAARLNTEMAEYAVKPGSPWRWVFLAGAVLAALWTALQALPLLLFRGISAGIGVIGGADGPTAIFLTGRVSPGVSVALGIAATALFFALYFILRRKGGPRP